MCMAATSSPPDPDLHQPAIAAPIRTISGYATDGARLKSIGASLLLAHDRGGDNRNDWGLFRTDRLFPIAWPICTRVAGS
jgi:hypothetical protein